MNRLDAAWAELGAEAEAAPGQGLLVRRILPGSVCDMWVGLQQPGASRILFVTVPRTSIANASIELGSAGIDAQIYALDRSDRLHVEIGIRLRDSRFADLFSALANDLVAHVGGLTEQGAVAEATIARIARWQQFLRRLNPEGLGPEAQRGLYGELLCLRNHIVPAVGALRAVSTWTGPQGADQDFQLGTVAIEAKTAVTHQLQTIAIASERQLDSTGLQELFVYFASLDARPHAGETLVSAVGAARLLVESNAHARDLLETRLLEAGYLDAHAPLYRTIGYTLRGAAAFRVAEGFPRIVESQLPRGLGSVQYLLSVSECEHFAVALSEMEAAARGTVDD